MAKATHSQNNFSSGEISPKSLGRYDFAKFANAVKTMQNYLIHQVGGALFRPGTVFVAETKTSAKESRLIPFQFSTTQTYALEFGNLYIRFYADGGIVGAPSETVSPYTESQLFELQFTQDADTLYIVHPSHAPRKLQRTSATTFTLTVVDFSRPPFKDSNITATTITPSADTGAGITLTASTAIFTASMVDSFVRVKEGFCKITAFTSTTIVTATVQAEPGGTAGNLNTGPAATDDWALSAFSGEEGYPVAVEFHEQRLFYGKDQKFFGSSITAYDNFDTRTTNDSDSVSYQLASRQVNSIQWLLSNKKNLHIGTAGGVFPASSGDDNLPITPTKIIARSEITDGAIDIKPAILRGRVYYTERDLNHLREIVYNLEDNSDDADDMNLLAEHILRDGSGAKEIAQQTSPNKRIWCVRNDGQIAVLTRNAKQEVMGWSRIIAGKSATGAGEFESIAIIPRPNEDDQVWVIVKRNINGSVVRYVEYFAAEDFDAQYDAVRVDSSLSLDNPLTITGITSANPVVITANSHGLAGIVDVKLNKIVAEEVEDDEVLMEDQLNNKHYKVSVVNANLLHLRTVAGVNVNGTTFSPYVSGGEVRERVTTLAGLDHLNGEKVTLAVDGGVPAAQQVFTVTGNSITLAQKVAVVHGGLPYTGKIQMLKLSDGSPTGTGQGKMRRIYLSTLRVFKTLGMKIGLSDDSLSTVFQNSVNDANGFPPDMLTGDIEKLFSTHWSKDAELIIQQVQPLPQMILAVILRSEVNEK